jgi:MFS family permease
VSPAWLSSAPAGLLLTRVSADGSYREDLLAGLLVFGAGLGAAFVASQIAALAGVREQESGLAAGLVDSSFNIGGALGVAILTTVAVSQTDGSAGLGREARLQAMTDGFQSAFTAAVGIAALGALLALLLFTQRTRTEAEPFTPVTTPAPSPGTAAARRER